MSNTPLQPRNDPLPRENGLTDSVFPEGDRNSFSEQYLPFLLLLGVVGGIGIVVCLLVVVLVNGTGDTSPGSDDAMMRNETQPSTANEPPTFSLPRLGEVPGINLFLGQSIHFNLPLDHAGEDATTLKFEIAEGPAGATIRADNGRLHWRPAEEDAGGEHLFVVRVANRQSPELYSQRSFRVHVSRLPPGFPPYRLSQLFRHEVDCPINAVCFSHDSQLVMLGHGVEIEQLRMPYGKPHQVINTDFAEIIGLDNSRDGRLLFAADGQVAGRVAIWEVESARLVDQVQFPGIRWISDLVVTQDADRLLVGARKPTRLVLGDYETGQLRGRVKFADLPSPLSKVVCAVSPDGQTCAAAHGDGVIYLYEMEHLGRRGQLHGHCMPVNGLLFLPDGETLGSTSSDGTVRLWDLMTQKQKSVITDEFTSAGAIACSPDGKQIAATGQLLHLPAMSVKVWSVDSGEELTFIRPGLWHTTEETLQFSPDGRYLVAAGDSKEEGMAVAWKIIDNRALTQAQPAGR